MSPLVLTVFLGSLALFAVLAVVLAGPAGGTRGQLRKRAKGLRSAAKEGKSSSGAARTESVLRTQKKTNAFVETLAERFMPRQSALRDRLARTGYDLSVGTYLLICVGAGVAGGALAMIFLGLPIATAALAGVGVGALLPHLAVGMLAGRRRARFLAIFPEAVALLVRGVKSGLPITEAISIVGNELPSPVGTEFRRISDHVRLGGQPDKVLWETARKLSLPEFDFFVISLSIQRETGGNLAETLNNLGDLLRNRRQAKLKVRAMSSEAKASAYILGSLPIAMFAIIYLLNPDYASMLFTDPRGQAMLAGGIASLVMCAAIMAKMIRFEI